MPERFDLDEVAEAYFSTRTPDRSEYVRLLIRARGNAVFPLLRALLGLTTKYKQLTKDIARAARESIFGEGGGRYMWAKASLESEVQNAYDIIRRIGEPAKIELCRALLERDYKMRLAAALLLSMDESPSEETMHGVQNALAYIKPDQKGAIVLMLLGIVFDRAGDAKWHEVIEDHARDANLSVEQWRERAVNTALIELQHE